MGPLKLIQRMKTEKLIGNIYLTCYKDVNNHNTRNSGNHHTLRKTQKPLVRERRRCSTAKLTKLKRISIIKFKVAIVAKGEKTSLFLWSFNIHFNVFIYCMFCKFSFSNFAFNLVKLHDFNQY